MKKLLIALCVLLLANGAALAQPSPPPGPWKQSTNSIYLNPGLAVTLPLTVPGGNMGPGTMNVSGLYLNGVPVIGTGSVLPCTAGQLAYYALSGSTVTCVPNVSNGVVSTNGSGVPSVSTTLPNGLAMGTPGSITLSNGSGLPISTGVGGLGTGIATILATTPTGTGSLVAATGPTLSNAIVGTQSANDNSAKASSTAYADRVLANLVIKPTPFSSSGTWTPCAGLIYATIEGVGGGGGGGGTVIAGGTADSYAAGSGAAGNYGRVTVSAATAGASQTVTLGAAGTAGASGNNNGGAGGQTSVGTLLVVKGGGGGGGNGGFTWPNGGAPGTAGTGDINGRNGQRGGDGWIFKPSGTAGNIVVNQALPGGSGPFGSGGSGNGTGAGAAGLGFGSGGQGGSTVNPSAAAAGAAGTAGFVLITEYCTH